MARRAASSREDAYSEEDDISNQTGSRKSRSRILTDSNNPTSPNESLASMSSDKENRFSMTETKQKHKATGRMRSPVSTARKRKADERDVSQAPTVSPSGHDNDNENNSPTPSQQAQEETSEPKTMGLDFYDPDQDINQRRQLRKDYRDLSRELSASGSDGLFKTLQRSNELYGSVKQTSDATLDSRLLVTTAAMTMQRTTQLNAGDGTSGIDVDDFVSKCMTFMRRAPAGASHEPGPDNLSGSTQRQRRRGRQSQPSSTSRQPRQSQANNDDDNEDHDASTVHGENMAGSTQAQFDEGDAYDWEWLGRQACYPSTRRAPVPGFLLGPLSVQKRSRRVTQRRERLERRDAADAAKPEELDAKDLKSADSSNLTTICTSVRNLLMKTCNDAQASVEQDLTEDMTEDEIRALMSRHGIADDGGVSFFRFVVNPKSFGQTVENLFYVSFLIRDGQAGVGSDSNMLPTLHPNKPSSAAEVQENRQEKRQAVFHLDFDTWQDIVREFKIKASVIPHRKTAAYHGISAKGWYT